MKRRKLFSFVFRALLPVFLLANTSHAVQTVNWLSTSFGTLNDPKTGFPAPVNVSGVHRAPSGFVTRINFTGSDYEAELSNVSVLHYLATDDLTFSMPFSEPKPGILLYAKSWRPPDKSFQTDPPTTYTFSQPFEIVSGMGSHSKNGNSLTLFDDGNLHAGLIRFTQPINSLEIVSSDENGAGQFVTLGRLEFSDIIENAVSEKSVSNGLIGKELEFKPKFGLSLAEAAEIGGYDHFNWFQLAIDPVPVLPGAPTVIVDPLIPGGREYEQWVDTIHNNFDLGTREVAESILLEHWGHLDDLPYYFNESGPVDSNHLDSHILPTGDIQTSDRLRYADYPEVPPGSSRRFITVLAGIHPDAPGQWDGLYYHEWETNATKIDFDMSNPQDYVAFRNLMQDPSTGGITTIGSGFDISILPLSVKHLLAQSGAANVNIPEPSTAILALLAIQSSLLLTRVRTRRKKSQPATLDQKPIAGGIDSREQFALRL